MIDELHTLASQLDRVIVVSHQTDFADTTWFPNGYSLRKARAPHRGQPAHRPA
jgi:hypothetical protein